MNIFQRHSSESWLNIITSEGSPHKKLPKFSSKIYNSLLSALEFNRDLRFEWPHSVERLMWFVGVLKDVFAALTVEIFAHISCCFPFRSYWSGWKVMGDVDKGEIFVHISYCFSFRSYWASPPFLFIYFILARQNV